MVTYAKIIIIKIPVLMQISIFMLMYYQIQRNCNKMHFQEFSLHMPRSIPDNESKRLEIIKIELNYKHC